MLNNVFTNSHIVCRSGSPNNSSKRNKRYSITLNTRCEVCGKMTKDRRSYNQHVKIHFREKIHPCEICGKKFKRKYEVTSHLRVHLNNESFECDFCAKKLKTRGSWQIHRKRHLKQFVVSCTLCDKGFVTYQEYENHMGSKHDIGSHICNVCGRKCCDKATLLNHMKRHEEGYGTESNIKCNFCEKTFYNPRNAKAHYSRVHKYASQGFICDHCGKKLNSKSSLANHVLSHQGIKPLGCPYCTRTFTLKTTLKIHIRTHTGDRPYECKVCGKAFSQLSPLKIHMRYHTGERPYICNLCESGFVSKAALSLHQKNRHKTVDSL